MLLRLSRILEILSAVLCIHRLYDRKVKFDICTISLVLSAVAIFDMINEFGFSPFLAIAVYGMMGIYCVHHFKDTVLGAVKSMLLMLFILTALQFFYLLFFDSYTDMNEEKTGIIVNILVGISCFWVLPKCRVAMLRKSINTYGRFLLPVTGFLLSVLFLLQLQQKMLKEINVDFFIISIPAGLLLLWMVGKWEAAQQEKTVLEDELRIAQPMQKNYEKLMKEIRLRQHEFKNHLTAILSTHYTCNSYEKLVQEQKKYCGILVQENKYSNLLMVGDIVFTGFLYQKFQAIERDGIGFEYEIRGKLLSPSVPVCYLVEMTGILLDNAVQAVQENGRESVIKFGFYELEDKYCFRVLNKFPYVGYEEIGSWFQMGKSSKGAGRGLGLHHIKALCEEWGCSIVCRNNSVEEENWIEFILEVGKADKTA